MIEQESDLDSPGSEPIETSHVDRRQSPRVVIIGAGFCGTMAAVHLLEAGVVIDVVVLDREARFARGLAYSTEAPEHLLNVPASGMSAFPDRPNDFLDWLRERHPETSSGAFAQRGDYGRYVESRLQRAVENAGVRGCRFEVIASEATAIVTSARALDVRVRGRVPIFAQAVVLAVGNLREHDPIASVGASLDAARYAPSPWRPNALEGIPAQGRVLLLGSGLTAVDVALSLRRRGHQGPVIALSRRGLLPQVHQPASPPRATFDPSRLLRDGITLRAATRDVRRAARDEAEAEGDWRNVVGALRPHTAALWERLSADDRARFLRHLRPFWDTHRHRMAPAVADSVLTLVAIGALEVRAGRVVEVGPLPQGAQVVWRPRGTVDAQVLDVARIINATGPSVDLRSPGEPLFDSLRRGGRIRPDAMGLGLATDADGAVLRGDGTPNPGVFTLGALRLGQRWETTAVPELRVQALAVARRILELIRTPARSIDDRAR